MGFNSAFKELIGTIDTKRNTEDLSGVRCEIQCLSISFCATVS